MTPYIIVAVLIILFICWLLWRRTNKEPECRGCRYNNMGECTYEFLCEDCEMWEPLEEERNGR